MSNFVNVQHGWFPEDLEWRIEASPPSKIPGLDIETSSSVTIHFPESEDTDSSGYLCLDLDNAEKVARQILDVVMDARMGRFTNEADLIPDDD